VGRAPDDDAIEPCSGGIELGGGAELGGIELGCIALGGIELGGGCIELGGIELGGGGCIALGGIEFGGGGCIEPGGIELANVTGSCAVLEACTGTCPVTGGTDRGMTGATVPIIVLPFVSSFIGSLPGRGAPPRRSCEHGDPDRRSRASR
jgi:hypothetical protein